MAFGSNRQFNGWNFFICYLVSLGQIAFGYPASIIGVTLAQPSFLIDMKLLDLTQDPPVLVSNADQIIGAMSGVSPKELPRYGCVDHDIGLSSRSSN
jgi:hypothetical protein